MIQDVKLVWVISLDYSQRSPIHTTTVLQSRLVRNAEQNELYTRKNKFLTFMYQANIGEAGSRLEVRRRGKFQSFVTKVESSQITMMNRGRVIRGGVKYRVEYRILGEFLSKKS